MRRQALLLLCGVLLGCGRQQSQAIPSAASTTDATQAPSHAANPPAAPASSATLAEAVPSSNAPAAAPTASAADVKFERRCGWVDNPTPANWTLTDRDGTWLIGAQGGYQADGEMPDFGKNWVETNVHYGYGCACLNALVDLKTKRVLEYRQVQVSSIAVCRADKALPKR